jgi:glycosyltransferase involved in cell wall biosynthesis
VHVIPHEVDLDLFSPTDKVEARAALGLDADRPYFLFASSPSVAVKNFPLARSALDLVKRTRSDAELLVLEREPQPRLALFMSACDALVFPSFQEGSPNIIKQAMACNLPIVASDAGDVAAVITGTEGCFVEDREPAAFARAMLEILDRGKRTCGRDAVLTFAPAAVADRLIAVYDSVLAPGRSTKASEVH